MSSIAPLVTAGWLADHLAEPGLKVVDATLFLPSEGRDAAQRFAAGHIPGARRFDIDLFSDPDSGLPHTVPSPERFAALAGALGLGDGDGIVCYDQRGLFSAARAWWLLRYFGHTRAAVLDGGLPAWIADGRPTEQGDPPQAAPATFTARPDPSRLRSLDAMRANLATGAELVLDARGGPRFHGAAPEPRVGMRGGHIPGSVSLPFGELLRPDGTMLPAAELRERLVRAGALARPVVTTCGSGVTACVVTLAMAVAGLPEGAVYDGSWSEWGGRPDTPVETSSARQRPANPRTPTQP